MYYLYGSKEVSMEKMTEEMLGENTNFIWFIFIIVCQDVWTIPMQDFLERKASALSMEKRGISADYGGRQKARLARWDLVAKVTLDYDHTHVLYSQMHYTHKDLQRFSQSIQIFLFIQEHLINFHVLLGIFSRDWKYSTIVPPLSIGGMFQDPQWMS